MMYNNWGMLGYAGAWSILFVPLILWSLFWKAWALWTAARRGEKIWFGVLMIINTAGILEILYIFVFCKTKMGDYCRHWCCQKKGECCQGEKCTGDSTCQCSSCKSDSCTGKEGCACSECKVKTSEPPQSPQMN